jgi:hypothetical protein
MMATNETATVLHHCLIFMGLHAVANVKLNLSAVVEVLDKPVMHSRMQFKFANVNAVVYGYYQCTGTRYLYQYGISLND